MGQMCALPPVLFRISIAAISFSGVLRNYTLYYIYLFFYLISCTSMYLEVSKLVSLTCAFFEPWGLMPRTPCSPPLFACHHSMTMAKKKRWSGWFRGQRHLEMVTSTCTRYFLYHSCTKVTSESLKLSRLPTTCTSSKAHGTNLQI